MNSDPYKVLVVVDRDFGEKLAALEAGVPVWIVDTPANKPVAVRLWAERKAADHLTGITTFTSVGVSSPEEMLLNELDTVDLHHGPHSANPPYTILQVIGARLTNQITAELSSYGFDEFHETADGFLARRPLPQTRSV